MGVHTDRPAAAGVLRIAVPPTPARATSVPPAKRTHGPAKRELIEQRFAYLIAHVDDRLEDQAKALGMGIANVSAYRQRLADRGLIEIKRLGPRHDWTEADDQVLRDRIGTVPHEQLAAELGTNLQGLLLRSKRLGISRRAARKVNADHYNGYDVARILGVDIHFVTHQMARWGLLRIRKHDWLKANGGNGRTRRSTMQWTTTRQDVIDFLIDYPWQYDRERITDPFFRRAADEAWERDPLLTAKEVARILGFQGSSAESGHAVSSFLKHTAPKFVPRSKLVIRRRGNPRNVGRSTSESGMQTFIPRSTLLAIQASGWVNYKKVSADTEHPTVETAAKLLGEREDRPGYVTAAMLRERLRRFYKCGAIPTREIKLGARKPWMIARSMDDVLELLPALFARSNMSARITPHHRALIRRHEPELLKDQRALLLAQATGELTNRLLDYMDQERRAEREFRLGGRTRAVYVAPHVARTLDILGNRTRYVGRRHGAAYHLQRCVRNLIAIPLKEARRHALRLCAHCDAVAKERGRRRRIQPVLVACSGCGDAFARPVGRPAKQPRCARCKVARRVGGAHRWPTQRRVPASSHGGSRNAWAASVTSGSRLATR